MIDRLGSGGAGFEEDDRVDRFEEDEAVDRLVEDILRLKASLAGEKARSAFWKAEAKKLSELARKHGIGR